MAKRQKSKQRRLTSEDQKLLLAEFIAESERPRPKRRRKVHPKPTKRPKPKRKTPKASKPKRTRAKIDRAKLKGSKYRGKLSTQEITHEFKPPLRIRHNSQTTEVANKIFDRFQKTIRFRKDRERIFTMVFVFKGKYKRSGRRFSALAHELSSTAELYDLINYAVDALQGSLSDYQMRNQWVRISQVTLKEYRELGE